jgi:hypothetical protein
MKTLGLVSQDDVYSNVGLLLSDQCPSVVKAATFAGTERDEFQDRREFDGSLFQQMEELYAYLDLRNRTGSTFQGLYRIDTRDYPEEALREALLNSIVHRDYSYSASTLVSVYADRMEFVSIGGLPDGVELEDIMLGLSVCRNPKLAAVFYRLKLIEAYGTGMPKIMNAYKGASRQPKIEVTSNAFKITLPNRNAEVAPDYMPEGPEGKILAYLSAHDSLVRSDVDTLLGVSQSTANRLMSFLVRRWLSGKKFLHELLHAAGGGVLNLPQVGKQFSRQDKVIIKQSVVLLQVRPTHPAILAQWSVLRCLQFDVRQEKIAAVRICQFSVCVHHVALHARRCNVALLIAVTRLCHFIDFYAALAGIPQRFLGVSTLFYRIYR